MSSSVSSTSSSLTTLSAKTGIGGLVSGLETEDIVNAMTAGTKAKIEAQQQKLQLLEWKQTAYRSVTTALKDFQSSYLDVLSSSNFRSASLYNTVAASTSSTAISVSTTSAASTGSITIDSISQLATNQTYVSKNAASSPLGGDLTESITAAGGDYGSLADSLIGKSFLLTRDGTTRTVTFKEEDFSSVADGADFESALQGAVDDAFGEGLVTVGIDTSDDTLSFTASGSTLTVAALNDDTDTIGVLGMTSGQTDKMSTSTTLENLPFATALGEDDTFSFTINDIDFTFNRTDNLSTVINRVNSSDAGVKMSYSSITDKFTLSATTSGSGNNIEVSETSGNLLTAMGLNGEDGVNTVVTEGLNAELSINGTSIIRSSNDVTVDGVKISLIDTSDEEIKINMTTDTTELKDKIKSFVEDYNTMIDLINSLSKEDKNSDYPPLTDDQKEEMSDDEIEKWETKAKSGLLRGDSILRGIANNMQTLMYTSAVSGGLTLYDLGIESAGYSENGKLNIDEDKLEEALANDIAGVQELFTTADTGIATGLNNIIDAAAKTSGARGYRGSLVEKAGYESTTSSTQNSIYDSIEGINEYIAKLQDQLETEESRYWSKFTALETALQQLNIQSSMISGFGTSS
jgi:flagellar hook-associated protein 2